MKKLHTIAFAILLSIGHEPGHFSGAHMQAYGTTAPPLGHAEFCQRLPRECEVVDGPALIPTEAIPVLDEINRRVNGEIAPAIDMDLYGVSEFWTIPTTRGDCEDYALLKRQWLLALGFGSGSLLMAVVSDKGGDGHAVLLARTVRGDLVLDNKVDDIRPWHATGYRFWARQSAEDPQQWVALRP